MAAPERDTSFDLNDEFEDYGYAPNLDLPVPSPVPTPDAPAGHYPFCSERCKLIDLGRWLDGKYQIPVAIDPRDEDDADER